VDNGLLKNFLKKLKLNESTISMILGALVIVVVGVLIFNYFRGVGKPKPEVAPTPTGELKLVKRKASLFLKDCQLLIKSKRVIIFGK